MSVVTPSLIQLIYHILVLTSADVSKVSIDAFCILLTKLADNEKLRRPFSAMHMWRAVRVDFFLF